MKTVALIDGNFLVRRAYHVVPDLCDEEGHPTGGIFGFLASLRMVLREIRPDRALVAFDGGVDPWRKGIYPHYKDRRESDPQKETERQRHGLAVAWQIEELRRALLPSLGVPFLWKQGVEADDLIYVARDKVLTSLGLRTVVVSSDKDFLQMVRWDTSVYDPMAKRTMDVLGEVDMVTLENFKDKTGMEHPRQYLDFKALVGDRSDRIPGIPGVGEVTAKAALEKFGTLRRIYAQHREVRTLGKRFALLADGRETAVRNLALMGLGFRKPSKEEIRTVTEAVLTPVGELDQPSVKAYCLDKQALDFVTTLPELFLLLREQLDRDEKFLTWVSQNAKTRERQSSRNPKEGRWIRDGRAVA